ncbi:MAG: hypothetical protein QNK31_11330 [Porticoccus sp.]|nr:hypothetical protein [Porticoccus sp.]
MDPHRAKTLSSRIPFATSCFKIPALFSLIASRSGRTAGVMDCLLGQTSHNSVDRGYIETTAGKNLGAITANNIRAAHRELESGHSIGKIVLQGF